MLSFHRLLVRILPTVSAGERPAQVAEQRLTERTSYRHAVAALAIVMLSAASAMGQSRQLFSVQGSGLLVSLHGEAFDRLRIGTGLGGEFQFRLNPGPLSLGIGVQITSHSSTSQGLSNSMNLTGFFVEPRYAFPIANRIVRPYVAARIAILNQSADMEDIGTTFKVKASATAIGGGAGFVARINDRVGFDFGLALTSANFGTYEYRDAGGDSGLDAGSGTSFVARAGFNIGIGNR